MKFKIVALSLVISGAAFLGACTQSSDQTAPPAGDTTAPGTTEPATPGADTTTPGATESPAAPGTTEPGASPTAPPSTP